MRNTQAVLAAAVLAAFVAGAPPAHAQISDAVRAELDALKARVNQLEKDLAKAREDAAKKGGGTADNVKVKNGSKLLFSGYAEARMTNIANPVGDRVANKKLDFQVNRFRPRFIYMMDKNFEADVQLNASTRSFPGTASVNTRDAYFEYHNPGGYARFGQQKIPFGWEVFREGDEAALALERARVFGVFFPDERDIGLTISNGYHLDKDGKPVYTAKKRYTPTVTLGVVNGDGINKSDGDSSKSVAINAIQNIGPHNTIGASFFTGTSTTGTPVGAGPFGVKVKNAIGVEHRLNIGRFSTQAEYLWGRANGTDQDGGYGLLAYNLGNVGNVFARHDIYDPDRDAIKDYWGRTSLGWFKNFTKQFRVTVEYDIVTNRKTDTLDDNTFGVEFQGNF